MASDFLASDRLLSPCGSFKYLPSQISSCHHIPSSDDIGNPLDPRCGATGSDKKQSCLSLSCLQTGKHLPFLDEGACFVECLSLITDEGHRNHRTSRDSRLLHVPAGAGGACLSTSGNRLRVLLLGRSHCCRSFRNNLILALIVAQTTAWTRPPEGVILDRVSCGGKERMRGAGDERQQCKRKIT